MERSVLFALISMVFAGVTAVLAKFGMKNISGDTALPHQSQVFHKTLARGPAKT
ncbi:MAG: hypothetical protein IPO90_11360 [Flavobacteriales bacterium]|nr:hypothetical protein [Flavobacteriales bacterium]MBL0044818.1 hypothetical protein [Flavobacteriales bacterium]